MKKRLAVLVVALVAGVTAGTASALDLPEELLQFILTAPEDEDLAVGAGKFVKTTMGISAAFNVAAHNTADDTDSPTAAHGHVRYNFTGTAEEHGTVECLFVTGNRAGVSGRFNEPVTIQINKKTTATFAFFLMALEDNGEPNSKGKGPDRALLALSNTSFSESADCGLGALASFGTFPLVQGNIVIKDRSPVVIVPFP